MEWTCREQRFDFSNGPLLMGILNVTPDSFSDGGRFDTTAAALQQATQMLADGADIIDIGGESTRPGAVAVDAATECQRVIPVIQAIRATHPAATLSIDTSKAAVADAALIAGAAIINDVTAMEGDSAMPAVACAHAAGVVLMHMQGDPRSMQQAPRYEDAVRDVASYLAGRATALEAAGLPAAHIALDPGIGFGKTTRHNLSLLASMRRFHRLGCPLLVGHSRKRFIGRVLDDMEADRTAGTIAVALSLAEQGVQVIRIHDVAPVRQALLMQRAVDEHGPGRAEP